ncbi:MAG: ATP-dependent DNA helicase [Patescibacteria group bacterium]|nr:ATP-dependent DNA helicase [Patescibacteria group bacterium]
MNISQFDTAYQKLNPAQKQAVDTLYGPVAVIAGPGTGKTQLLTLRIANILKSTDVQPHNILALTFTEAGAIAMRQRLVSFIGPAAYQVQILTFHGFCNEMIQSYSEEFQFSKTLQSISELEKRKLLSHIFRSEKLSYLYNRFDPEMYLYDTLSLISQMKREQISPDQLNTMIDQGLEKIDAVEEFQYQRKYKDKQPGDFNAKYYKEQDKLAKNKEFVLVYKKYEEQLKEKGWYDFDDMIGLVLKKMNEDSQFHALLQEQFQFIMVDEYQDTNGVQNAIVSKLIEGVQQPNILVVGDDEQSIYRFQGAVMENVLEFFQTHASGGMTSVVLSDNYRSTQKILDASRELVRNNTQSLEKALDLNKKLISHTTENTPIEIYQGENENTESYYIIKQIEKQHAAGIPFKEMAIIYRNNADSLELIEAMRRAGIPFKKQKGENLLHLHEAQKLLRTLELIESFETSHLLWEVLSYDFMGLNVLDLMHLQNQAREEGVTFFQMLLKSENEQITEKLERIIALKEAQANTSLVGFFEHFLEETGYREYILQQEDKLERLNILNSLFNEIKSFASEYPQKGVSDFLQYLQDLEFYGIAPVAQPLKTSDDAVQLMTAHGSKGLEYDVVFIMKTISSRWEAKRSVSKLSLSVHIFEDQEILSSEDKKLQSLEEERRLFYVAMTRARRYLYITSAKNYAGSDAMLSRFVSELPDDICNHSEVEDIDNTDLLTLFTSAPQQVDWTAAFESELRERANKYVLSVTALNTWIASPKEFLERHLIRIPSAKNTSASFGTIVHEVLNQVSRNYQKTGQVLSHDDWVDVLHATAEKEILSGQEREKIIEEAESVIDRYISVAEKELTLKAESEVYFGFHPVVVEGMPIKGMIDRIEYQEDGSVVVVDYKTGKSKKSKEQMEGYIRQMYFYKLLYDGSGRKEPLSGGVFDFVEDLQDSINRKIISYDTEKMDELRRHIKAFKESLDTLNFPEEHLV